MNEILSQERGVERSIRGASPRGSRGNRAISVAVNSVGVLLVAGAAYFLGNALYEGVTSRAVAIAAIGAVVTMLMLAPDVGLLLWMVLAPFSRLFNLPMGRGLPDLSLSRVAAMVLLALILAQVAAGKRHLVRLTAVEGWGLVFVLAMLLSVSTSRLGWIGGIQNLFDYAMLPLLCFFFARNLFAAPKAPGRSVKIGWLAVALALVVAALGLIAAREQLTNQPVLSPLPYRWEYGRLSVKVTSLFGAPAIMAMSLALPLPFVLVGAMHSRELAPRLLWFLALAAAAAGLLLTYVRAGWLAAIVELAVVTVVSRRGRGAAFVVPLIALLVALVWGAGLVDLRSLQERLHADQPIQYRLGALSVGLEIAARSPLLGLGLDNYSDAAIAAGWQPTGRGGRLAVAPHNLFIYILTSGGLLALVPFLAMLSAIALRLFRNLWALRGNPAAGHLRDWLIAALAMLIGYLLIGNTFDALGAQFANMMFFVALGATFAAADAHAGEPSP